MSLTSHCKHSQNFLTELNAMIYNNEYERLDMFGDDVMVALLMSTVLLASLLVVTTGCNLETLPFISNLTSLAYSSAEGVSTSGDYQIGMRPSITSYHYHHHSYYRPRSRGDNTFGSIHVCVRLSVGALLLESFDLDFGMRVDLDLG